MFDSDDITGSQGSYKSTFTSNRQKASYACAKGGSYTGPFNVGDIGVRQVEPRNTPTVINAIFNFRNFWDGRANNVFNGRNPFGRRDPTAGRDPENSILVPGPNGQLIPEMVEIYNASRAWPLRP